MLYPIFKKEVQAYLTSPAFYVVAAAFFAVSGFLYYSNLVMMLLFQGSAFTVNLWEYTVNDVRLLVMVLVPYVAMRTFAEEKKHGTLELLFTAPLGTAAIVLGKFFGAFSVVLLILSGTMAYPLLYGFLYPLDWGPVASAYLGLVLLAMALLALGIFISSLTEHQIIVAGCTIGCSFLLWFLKDTIQSGNFLSTVTDILSLRKHFFGMNRGVIASRDVLFFILFCIYFLTVTHAHISQRDDSFFGIGKGRFCGFFISRLRFFVILFIGGAVFVIAMITATKFNMRFDLTPGKAYTLSNIAKERFQRLDAPLRLTVACETAHRYQVEDFLDLFVETTDLFHYRLILIDKNKAAAQLVSLDTPGSGIVEYKGKKITLPQLHEHALVQALDELMAGAAKIIYIYTATGDNASHHQYAEADAALQQAGYALVFSGIQDMRDIPNNTCVAVIRNFSGDIPAECLTGLGKFFENGGGVLFLIGDGPLPVLEQFLHNYNIELGNDIIIGEGNAAFNFDPLMQLMFPNKEHPAFGHNITPAVFFRARSVQVGTTFREGYRWMIACTSGRHTWAETDFESIQENRAVFDAGKDAYGPVASGVTVIKKTGEESDISGRMAVIGCSSFITNEYYSMLGNADFYTKIISWLAHPQKKLPHPPLVRKAQPPPIRMTAFEGALFFWLFVVGEPVLMLFFGAGCVVIRRIRN